MPEGDFGSEQKTSPEIPAAKAPDTEADFESAELQESKTEEESAEPTRAEAEEPTRIEERPEVAAQKAELFDIGKELNDALFCENIADANRTNEGRVAGALKAYDRAREMLGDVLKEPEPDRRVLLQLQGLIEKGSRLAELGGAFDWPMSEEEKKRSQAISAEADEARRVIEDRLEGNDEPYVDASAAESPASEPEVTKVVAPPKAETGPAFDSGEVLESKEAKVEMPAEEAVAEEEPSRELAGLGQKFTDFQERFQQARSLEGIARIDAMSALLAEGEDLQEEVVRAEQSQLFAEDQRAFRDLDLEMTRFLMHARREVQTDREQIDLPDETEAAELIPEPEGSVYDEADEVEPAEEEEEDIFADVEVPKPAISTDPTKVQRGSQDPTRVTEGPPAE